MNFLKFFTSIFGSLFKTSSVDAKTRHELKRIENELKLHVPTIYKNGALTANVAEAFVLLYINTKYIEEILSSTIKSTDIQRATGFANKLIVTGFPTEAFELQEKLLFENRKSAVLASENETKTFEEQTKDLGHLLKILGQEEFSQINTIIAKLYQLCDICRFNFIGAVRAFVPNFSEHTELENTEINNVPVAELETMLMDLYYVTCDFQITSSMAKAVVALATIHANGKPVDQDKILENLKKISYVFKHILQPKVIFQLLVICKQDPKLSMETAQYSSLILPNYIEHLKKQFEVDTNRIRVEVQDETVASEIKSLFGDRELEPLAGYNAEQNEYLLENHMPAFAWITPMQVLKNFLAMYIGANIQSLLNDIVVEGFFCNATFKTDFSTAVFATLEAHEKLQGFEATFDRNNPNDIAVLRGYVADSHTNPEFLTKLTKSVEAINAFAQKMLQEEAQHILNLYRFLSDMLEDAKLISPMNITNIKVLLASSRNKDNALQLESQLGDWQTFLSVMRNYTVVGEVEAQ